MLLIGSNAKLEIRGVGCGCVKKIYDHPGNVADLKDLRQKNLVQVVCEMEVSPTDATAPGPCAEWILTFDDSKTGKPQKLVGSVAIPFVASKEELKTNADAVSIVLTMQAAVLDAEVLHALDAGKREEAAKVKAKQVEMLSSAGGPHVSSCVVDVVVLNKSKKVSKFPFWQCCSERKKSFQCR